MAEHPTGSGRRTSLVWWSLLCILTTLSATRSGYGQPPVSAAPTQASTVQAEPAPSLRAAAMASLKRGLRLYRQQEWDAALAEFVRSRELYPARGNTLNSALCLQKLKRYDEALDMFEILLREVPNLPPRQRKLVEREVGGLRALVGAVEVRVIEPGAKVLVDGRQLGTTPLSAPLRVKAGTHWVRIVKSGFEPLEVRVSVAGEQLATVEGKLEPLSRSGQLKVSERSGRTASVLVDNVQVGPSPWEGTLPVGIHTVILQGEGDWGTQPATATVRHDQVAVLNLELEPLRCGLRVEPTPVSAIVAIDGVAVGNGLWEGKLRCGRHRVEVAADGFLKSDQQLGLTPDRRELLVIALERDPTSPLWRAANPPRVVFDLAVAPALSPGLGGDVVSNCGDGCDSSVPAGVLLTLAGGYQFSVGIGLGLELGYVRLMQKLKSRALGATQLPSGVSLVGTADDTLVLDGALLGATVWLRRGSRFPLTIRLGGGVLLGEIRDERTADLQGIRWDLPLQKAGAYYGYIAPEIRLGYRVAERFELAAVLQAFLLFAISSPRWQPDEQLYRTGLGFVDFGNDALAGDVFALIAPGIGASYEFY